jgi:hypothetical protein
LKGDGSLRVESWHVDKGAGGNQTLSGTTVTDCTSITQTIDVKSTTEVFYVTLNSWMLPGNGHTQITALNVDGTDYGGVIAAIGNASGGAGTYSATWRVTGIAVGSRVFKIRGNMAAVGQTGGWAGGVNTWMDIHRG